MERLNLLRNEMEVELLNHIMPFWSRLRDPRGGFYGYVDFDLHIDKNANKGVILNSRILWFYSNIYLITGQKEALKLADHAFDFLIKYCIDEKYGGVYWMLNMDGIPCDEMKHTYNQAFAIYGLSSYYAASKNSSALELANQIFNIIETRCIDDCGYVEAFDRKWKPIDNEKLSEDGFHAAKTMNTLLHIIEAYTELYRISNDNHVGECLTNAVEQCLNKVYNPQTHILGVYFDKKMNSIADVYSYGHDIEASWLLDRACELLDNEQLTAKIELMTLEMADKVLQYAYKDGALNNQSINGIVDTTRIWWVQAESVVGFLNAYQKTKDEAYLDITVSLWKYIKTYIIDKREGSEWYWDVNDNGEPVNKRPIVEPWKCPYHNGRMCMEVMKRYEKIRTDL
ncbi:AGE family epimerase/isomerase [Xylanivirga thermophila]|uniref:AGE family epimerase/isomerase n=1 Tax=Xylanivirga thermophila TaxID=2496273 RepID=UPI00101DA188|nr:AGE family epimerase/isomerase [Xylanivirga thermophila]